MIVNGCFKISVAFSQCKSNNCNKCNGFEIRDYFQEIHVGEDDILFTNHLVGK